MSWRTKLELLAATLMAGLVWWLYTPKPEPVHPWKPAQPAPQLDGVSKAEIKPPKVDVYAPKAKAKFNLPPDIQNDPHIYVLGAARLPNDTHPHTFVATINDTTGVVQMLDHRESLPWFSFNRSGELRLDYGIKRGVPVLRMALRQDVLQVKALHTGVNIALDSDGSYFLGGGIGWRW